ncbi:MAG: 6,7-dimethyl-8-ribityllumazine synthase [Bacteroidales bacterium]|nr:6,7-dimethyl-8-ribityllumazine synthase [Bacteroidales bacterium]
MRKETDLSRVHAATSLKKTVGDSVRIGVVTAEWNPDITQAMRDACIEALVSHGVNENRIQSVSVPGSFELPYAAQQMIQRDGMDAVICIGCVIQGETRHFEFIAQATAQGIMRVALENNTPVIFGVLTTQNMQQALDRAGGAHGNKGVEAALTCLKMLSL